MLDCKVNHRFSALQRAEIAEIEIGASGRARYGAVSVLFNEPKLLKLRRGVWVGSLIRWFQCSSTSRNC